MIGLHSGKVASGSARNVARAFLIAAALALVSGAAAAIECPKGWVPSGNSCRKDYGVGTTPQTVPPRAPANTGIGPCSANLTAAYLKFTKPDPGTPVFQRENGRTCYIQLPAVAPPQQPRAPATAAPAACSAGLVARYLAEVSKQPPSRRPATGSVVALTENGKTCVMQMPAAAAAPPPQQQQGGPVQPPMRVVVRGPDGKLRIMTLAEAAAAGGGPPQFRTPSLAGEFSNLGSTPLLIGAPMQSYAGELVFGPLPNAPPGYLTKAGLAYDWAEARLAAGVNWARENKAEAAILALSMAVSFALPQLPAVAALGSLGSTLVAGLTAPVVAATTTSFINTLASTGRTDKAFLGAAKDAAVVVVKFLPGAFVGETFSTIATDVGAPALIAKSAEYAGSKVGDLAVNYGPAVLSRSVPAERTVSFTLPTDR